MHARFLKEGGKEKGGAAGEDNHRGGGLTVFLVGMLRKGSRGHRFLAEHRRRLQQAHPWALALHGLQSPRMRRRLDP